LLTKIEFGFLAFGFLAAGLVFYRSFAKLLPASFASN